MDKPLTDAERNAFLEGLNLFVETAEECGFKMTPVPVDEYRRSVEADRREDRRLLASGEMSADELQERNSWFTGEIQILDKSPSYA
jgi:hypothetical protein